VSAGARSVVPLLLWAAVGVLVAVLAVMSAGRASADSHLRGDVFDFGISVPDGPLTAGDTIVFANIGERPHTVTDRGNTFDTDGILPGGTAEVTFTAPGTYAIFCRINPGSMNATVVVEAGPESPTEVRIQAIDQHREGETLRFEPPDLEVQPGTRVTVANVGGLPHTLTAVDGAFDTGRIEPGAEEGRFAGEHATFVVTAPGTYAFLCEIHPQAMQGTLVVAGDAVAAEPEPPPEDPPDPGAGAQASAAVDMLDFSFDPVEVAVLPGGEVTWTNQGQAPHTATFDDVEG
jgi:plastocyanin